MTSNLEKLFGVFLLIMLVCFGLIIGGYIIPTYEDNTDVLSDGDYLANQTTINSINYNNDMNIDKAQSGIVTVYAKSESEEEIESQGSGFMYTEEHIMTNDHVINGHSEFYVQYQNGEWSSAEFVGTDRDTDIAIVKPENIPDYVSVLPMQMNVPQVGESVVAIGSPGGLDNTITTGVVSSNQVFMEVETNFGIPDTIQTDAALNPGNSGGPLYSQSSDSVIGVNRATVGQNIGYAISSRVAHTVGQNLIETGSHEHGYIGIKTAELEYNNTISQNVSIKHGLIISDISEDGPSSDLDILSTEDGFSVPDIIVKVDDKNIRTNEDLASYIMLRTEPGDEVELKLYRDGTHVTKTIEIGHRLLYTN